MIRVCTNGCGRKAKKKSKKCDTCLADARIEKIRSGILTKKLNYATPFSHTKKSYETDLAYWRLHDPKAFAA